MDLDRRSMLALPLGAAALAVGAVDSPAYAKAPLADKANAGFYRYKIGDYQVTAINDGYFDRPLDGFVRNAELAEVQTVLADSSLAGDKLRIPFTTSVINTGSKLIMIDAGNGDIGAPTSGTWMENFKAAGFKPEDVDLIIFSHFHGDHINGLRLKDGSSPFANAEIMVPAKEWAYWTDEGELSRAPDGIKANFANVRRVFDPIKAKIVPYEAGKEVAPGISSVAAYGHTPGHTAFAVSSGSGKLMLLQDTTNHPALFVRKPEWSAIFDMDGPAAAASRRRMLDMAIAEKVQVAFYHAPFPATGTIVKHGAGYRLVPTAWSST